MDSESKRRVVGQCLTRRRVVEGGLLPVGFQEGDCLYKVCGIIRRAIH